MPGLCSIFAWSIHGLTAVMRNNMTCVQMNIRLTEGTFKYTWIPKIWPNKYLNILWCPVTDRANIQIYLDGGKATNINTNYIFLDHLIRIFDHTNVVFLNKAGKKGNHNFFVELSKIMKSGRHMVNLHMKWVWTNIWIHSNAKELTKQISDYIWIAEKPQTQSQILFVGHLNQIFLNLNIHACHWVSVQYLIFSVTNRDLTEEKADLPF